MMAQTAVKITEAFNDCINRQDLNGLSALMTDDHRFIDPASQVTEGGTACVAAWRVLDDTPADRRLIGLEA